jgi:signal transduction histidine kinase
MRGDPVVAGSRARWIALVHVAIGLALLASVEAVLMVDGPVEPTWLILAFPLMGCTYGTMGLEAWRRRPSNRVGPLLVLGAWSWLLAGLANVENPVLVTVGQMTAVLGIAVIVHLVLAFPSGRLPDRASRAIVAAAYVTTTVLELPLWLFDPASPAMLADDPELDRVAEWTQRSIGSVILVAMAVVAFRRLRLATPAARRVLGPVLGYGIFTAVMVPLSANIVEPLTGIDPITRATIQLAVLMVLPIAFGLGLLWGGFAPTGELVELGVRLGADVERPDLRVALADILGDASVNIGFWLPDQQRYVDAAGRPFVRSTEPGRGHADIELAGRRVGVIAYDAALIHDAELVRTAGRILAIAVERQRLDAELRASHEALRESRSRIVEATDAERRRIVRDLHDGLQGRLVLLGVQASHLVDRLPDGEERAEAELVRGGIVTAIDELRDLVHGVLPALLIERGLQAATEELVDRMPIPTEFVTGDRIGPLPTAVESTAFFVVAEGLANALKHSGAERMSVRLEVVGGELVIEVSDDGLGGALASDGNGLRGIGDRVDALGGRLSVDSPPGGGTRMLAEVPCGS